MFRCRSLRSFELELLHRAGSRAIEKAQKRVKYMSDSIIGLIIYTKPAAVQCTATLNGLDEAGLDYEVFDVSVDEKALEFVRSLGYLQAPVVITSFGDHWSGFRPDKIAVLAEIEEFAQSIAPKMKRAHIDIRQLFNESTQYRSLREQLAGQTVGGIVSD